MTLLAGHRLDHKVQYFSSGDPVQCGSSYDLTVGKIIDTNGKSNSKSFVLKPRQMVQVVTNQVFQLPNTVTGHVTCKTSLTKEGIWALTVGIIDPGWNGPIATTLVNFGKVDHLIQIGDPFLRVSLFEHDKIDEKYVRRQPKQVDGYLRKLYSQTATYFPTSFLDTGEISKSAGEDAAKKMQKMAVMWLPFIMFLIAIFQIAITFLPPFLPGWAGATLEDVNKVETELRILQDKLVHLEGKLEQ
jgi:deoxycytidine triphosphate deaminase